MHIYVSEGGREVAKIVNHCEEICSNEPFTCLMLVPPADVSSDLHVELNVQTSGQIRAQQPLQTQGGVERIPADRLLSKLKQVRHRLF